MHQSRRLATKRRRHGARSASGDGCIIANEVIIIDNVVYRGKKAPPRTRRSDPGTRMHSRRRVSDNVIRCMIPLASTYRVPAVGCEQQLARRPGARRYTLFAAQPKNNRRVITRQPRVVSQLAAEKGCRRVKYYVDSRLAGDTAVSGEGSARRSSPRDTWYIVAATKSGAAI